MPPKKRAAATESADGAAAGGSGAGRRSKLAKEHNISAQQEADIREAFSLFAQPRKGEKDGVLPTRDVRNAMIALGIPPTRSELPDFLDILDPESEGFVSLEPFVAVCALKLHARERDGGAQRREVDEAFALFTTATLPGSGGADKGGKGKGKALDSLIADDDDVQEVQGPDQGAKITFAHLKRVAAILKLDDPAAADGGITVTDDLLRDMILEANGGAGVSRGVSRDEFEEVMRRAGVWR